RQRIRPRRQGKNPGGRTCDWPRTERKPDGRRWRQRELVSFNEKSAGRRIDHRRERDVVQVAVRNDREPTLACEQTRLLERCNQLRVEWRERRTPESIEAR